MENAINETVKEIVKDIGKDAEKSALEEAVRNYPILTLIICEAIFGWLGYYIVTRYLMDKQIKNFFPKTIFTITFMCALGLLFMYLYEIFNVEISQSYWDFILAVLVILCVIVIPICLLFKVPFVMYQCKIGSYKIPIIAVAIMILYLNIVASWYYYIKQMKQISSSIDIFSKQFLNILAQIGVRGGVYIMALLSAYGSIWTPYIYFNHIDTMKVQLKEAKKKTKDEINFVLQQIKNNKYQLLLLNEKQTKVKKTITDKASSEKQHILLKGIKSLAFFKKNNEQQELKMIQQKVIFHKKQLETLNKVHQQSFSVYRQIVDEQRKHNISETLLGKMFRLVSFVLCVYSVTKILLAIWNMIVGRQLSTDPITRFVSFTTNKPINSESTLFISFVFMGYLMISNVRSFSINMKNFFDFIFRRRRLNILSTDTLVLLLSEMYGIYFLSVSILLQSGLPRTYVTNFEQITGKVLLVQHFTLFDKIYFWCCLLSAAFISIVEYQRKQKMKHIINERNLV